MNNTIELRGEITGLQHDIEQLENMLTVLRERKGMLDKLVNKLTVSNRMKECQINKLHKRTNI